MACNNVLYFISTHLLPGFPNVGQHCKLLLNNICVYCELQCLDEVKITYKGSPYKLVNLSNKV